MEKSKLTNSNFLLKYNLNKNSAKIIEFVLRFPGIKHEEIASLCGGLSRASVSVILKKQNVIDAISELEGRWFEKLIRAKTKAATKLISLIDNPNPAIAIRACEDILQLDKVELLSDAPEEDPY